MIETGKTSCAGWKRFWNSLRPPVSRGRRSVDSRILGCDSFVEKVLARVGCSERHLLFQKSNQIELEGWMSFIAEEFEMTSEEIRGESRRRDTSRARSVLCWACMTQFGVSGKRLSSILGMTPFAVYLASLRGEACVNHNPDLKKSIGNYLNNRFLRSNSCIRSGNMLQTPHV
jgi:hypothetical protein